MISLEEYKKTYGNDVPDFHYTKECLATLFEKIKNTVVENWVSFFPESEGGRSFTEHIVKNKAYYQFVYHFFPNYFNVRTKKFEPISNVFKDDVRLQKAINMYNRYYGNKPGGFNLHYFVKPLSMCSNVYKAGNFSPVIAKYIYDLYTKDGETVFDFSAGFGGRMLGAMTSRRRIHYVGIEPYVPTYAGLCNLYDFFQTNSYVAHNSCEIYNSNIEEFIVPEELIGNVSLCFSSPPFYDLELYTTEDNPGAKTQASYMYKTKEDFMKGFFGAVVEKSHKMLKNNGLLVINIKDSDRKKTVSSFLSFMKTTKFKESNHILMHTNNMTYGTSLGRQSRREPIFVFRKEN